MRLRVLAVVVLVVATAGCNAFAGGASNTPTLTPATVPTQEPTPTDPRIGVAPGVTTTGVTHPEFLAQRHVDAASNTSYRWTQRYRSNRSLGNSSSVVARGQRIVVENATVYRREDPSYETWVDGQRLFRTGYSQYANGNVTYSSWFGGSDGDRVFRRRPATGDQSPFARFARGAIQRYLTLESATVSRYDVTGSDARYYLVTGTRSSLPTVSAVENYSARAVIRKDGFVRNLTVSYDSIEDQRQVSVQYTFSYQQVGNATVTPPEWADEARANFEAT